MADVITRLKVESTEYDSKIKRASQGLLQMEQACRKVGGTLAILEKDELEFVKGLGKMETVSKDARGQLNELTKAFTDLSLQYKRLTDEEKQGDFGKALSASLDQLKTRIQDTKKDLADIGQELSGTKNIKGGGLFSGLGDKMSGALQVFAGNMLTKAASAVAQLGSEMYDMVQQGIELARQGEGIRVAFERLGRGDILDGLRQATHGTVTDIELMKAAVKFNDFKLPIEELGTMLAFAQQKAKDTGQSVDYMVDSIVTGLGRKSLMILDNLGLSASEIKDRMAETGDMTKAVGAIIRDQMAAAGDYVETAADRAAQANVDLQNKMEELGRKFAPVEEASTRLWTSMKIGILDVVGGPLARLLNGLTEAGRLKNTLDDMNGDGSDGKPTQVQQQLSTLRGAKYKNAEYKGQLGRYDKEISEIEEIISAFGGKGKDAIEQGIVNRRKLQLAALKAMRAEYIQGAKTILQPVKPNIDTKPAEQNVASLTQQLKKLEEQRKKAVIAGDQEQVDNITKQISQVKTNIGYLQPNALKTTPTTSSAAKTETQQNEAAIAKLTEEYQNLATAAKTADDAQKAGMTERMTAIQGEIRTLQERNTELKKFADEAKGVKVEVAAQGSLPQLTQQLKDLQQAQSQSLDTKQWVEYQKQIDVTNTKIDILKGKWKEGQVATFSIDTNNTEAYDKLKNLEGVNIGEETITVTADTAEAYNKVQELIGGIEGTSVSFEVKPQMKPLPTLDDYRIQAMIEIDTANTKVDTNTLQTLLQDAIQQGIDITSLNLEPIAEQIGKGIDVPDSAWEGIMDGYKELCEEIGADPIKIDLKTGNKAGSEVKDMKADWKDAAGAVQSLGSALQSIEDPAAKVVGIIAQAIATVALTFSKSLAGTVTPWDWIAGAIAGTATMISTIAAIKSATSGGFAEGGIVPGNSYSGDKLRLSDYGVNSGELILNRAQQDSIASQLQQGEGEGMTSAPFVTADKIVLGVNNWGRATGRGQLVFAKN